MSEVEELFYRIQKQTGGNLQWGQISTFHQEQFVQAVNYILAVSSAVKN